MRTARLGFPIALLTVVAAGVSADGSSSASSEPVAAVVKTLTQTLACDDTLVAREPEGTAALGIVLPGLLDRARNADLPYREKIDLSSSDVLVRFELGADLDHWCTDVMDQPPQVDEVWIGIAGTADIVLTERASNQLATGKASRPVPTTAILRLSNAVLEREGSSSNITTIPDLEITGRLGVPTGG